LDDLVRPDRNTDSEIVRLRAFAVVRLPSGKAWLSGNPSR